MFCSPLFHQRGREEVQSNLIITSDDSVSIIKARFAADPAESLEIMAISARR